jgi:hypothetical protein
MAMTQQETFEWLRERSNRLTQVEQWVRERDTNVSLSHDVSTMLKELREILGGELEDARLAEAEKVITNAKASAFRLQELILHLDEGFAVDSISIIDEAMDLFKCLGISGDPRPDCPPAPEASADARERFCEAMGMALVMAHVLSQQMEKGSPLWDEFGKAYDAILAAVRSEKE